MKNMKTLLMSMSSVIVATISLSAFGGSVFAAPGDLLEPTPVRYGIWVANTEITSENKDNVLEGDSVNDGKVKFDPDTHTLSFDDAVITTGYEYDDDTYGIFVTRLSQGNYDNSFIYMNGSVKISDVSVGILAEEELTIDSKDYKDVIDIKASNMGIDASFVRLEEAKVSIDMSSGDNTVAIAALDDVEIAGTDLTITGDYYGIMANGDIIIAGQNDPNVSITSTGSCLFSRGTYIDLYCGNIDLKSTGDKSAFTYVPATVVASQVLTSGPAKIKVDSNASGIAAESTIKIDGSDLRLNAKDYGLVSYDSLDLIIGYSHNCIEINAGTAVAASEINVDTDLVKAPKNCKISFDNDTFMNIIANEDDTCATYVVINGYELSYIEASEPTLEKEGNIAYYQAGTAGDNKIFEDELGTKEITDKTSVIIPKLVAMPDVTGKNYEEAKTLLEAFLKDNNIDATVNVGWASNSDSSKNLLVAESMPAAGTGIGSSTKEITITAYEGYNPPANDNNTTNNDNTPNNNESSDKDVNDPNAKIASFVERLYKFVLGREAEEGGKKYWVNELTSFNQSGAQVAQGFVFSAEFINSNATDEQFVETLYKTFFDRESDAEGLKYWVGLLSDKKATRQEVANGFIFSQEWADTCASYGILSGIDIKPSTEIKPTELTYSFVERLYKTALNREFDAAGREYWAVKLANFTLTGEQVGAEFFLSAEMKDMKLSNEEFVNRLYLTFMNREPEAEGKAYWIGLLDKGTDRSSVVFGFTRSAEFTEKCVEARIIPC
ncbi:MAG: DUF4214 domain-containing protein [Clostridiales bacterium]|nr:DUF4214 domain-containing protein [Clostridiales bacterium]